MTTRTAKGTSITSDPTQRIGTFIDNDRLEIVGLLGLGAYGAVYLGRHVLTRKHYAVKCLNRIGLTKRQHGFQQREIALHQMLSDHPNILTLEKVIHTPECIYMILEYSREGDLFNAITETNCYTGNDRAIRRVFLQIIDAVMYCHHYGVYHRDLKPENILVFEGGTRVKLADFGLATMDEYSVDFGCGSTFYFSPGR
jgi:serine/threonine protein kinase